MNEHGTSLSLSRSQAQLLEQLNNEEFWFYAAEIANPPPVLQDVAEEYLICDSGASQYIFPLTLLCEIVPLPQLTSLPAVPSWMSGVVAWCGEMIAVVDLKVYLWNNGDSKESDSLPLSQQMNLLLVVRFRDLTLGLIVGAVGTPIKIDEGHVVPFELAPDWCSALRSGVIKGVLEDTLLLDIPFIFDDIVRCIKEYPSL